jgi:hypothetical protein
MPDMADRLALVIGVETHQDAALPPAPHADGDAHAFARALEPLGFGHAGVTLLTAGQATRTALASRLRKLVKSPPAVELLLVFYAGHAFAHNGSVSLACHDTQADDLAETTLPLPALLDALESSGCRRLALFLDVRGTLGDQPLLTASLEAFGSRPGSACFLSCSADQRSHVSGSLKSGVWAHHVVEAFAGKAPRALDGFHLTAASLQAYLDQEVPRTLRATFREAPPQTPRLFAPRERFVLAEVHPPDDQPVADPRLQPLKRGSLRGETAGRVKALAGFRKFHRLPDKVNASARKFVAEIAHDDVKQDVDSVYAAVREALGYKRRDVEGSADRGSGFVRTPDFEYSVSVELADDDPTGVVWRREVAGIRSPDVVLGKPFQRVFAGTFDTLVFEFTRPFDLEAWVDRIEEELPAGVRVRTSSDCSSCDVQVAGSACVVRLYRDRVEIQGQRTPGSRGLVEAFLQFRDLFSGRRDLQELPLLGASENGV